MHGYLEARRQPSETELRAHMRSRAFHAKIAERAAALKPAPIAPQAPAHPVTFTYAYEGIWIIAKYGPPPANKVAVRDILSAVCRHFGAEYDDLVSARQSKLIVHPRQIAAYLCKEMTRNSLAEIGRRIGGRDHSTIFYAHQKIAALILSDPAVADDIADIRAALKALP